MPSKAKIYIAIFACLVTSCGKQEQPPAEPPAAPAAKPKAPVAAMPKLERPPDPGEACGQVIVVAWKGAAYTSAKIVRTKMDAQFRAEELLERAKREPDFAALARQNSDASSSGPRGGIIGTYKIEAWPEAHMPIRDTVFGLMVNQIADKVVETPYGYVIARRCPVEKAHGRHILVRFKGALRADPRVVTRGREEAKALAEQIRAEVTAPGADFAKIAREKSEDRSAEKGGDIGTRGRGMLAPPFEQALFSLKPNEISEVVETEFGFHIIQRLPDEPPAAETLPPAPASKAPAPAPQAPAKKPRSR